MKFGGMRDWERKIGINITTFHHINASSHKAYRKMDVCGIYNIKQIIQPHKEKKYVILHMWNIVNNKHIYINICEEICMWTQYNMSEKENSMVNMRG